jgi:hypothetical protein
VAALAITIADVAAADTLATYSDPQRRFSFSYPASFGSITPGTNSGFQKRVAAFRFQDFSSVVRQGRILLGGEAVLTTGAITVDMQALGGLYDPFGMEAFPTGMRTIVEQQLPLLDVSNFCGELAKESHVDLKGAWLASLAPSAKEGIVRLDQLRNIDPKVIRCDVKGDTIVFDKEATFTSGTVSARQHIYGAVRFLRTSFSSFQLIRAGLDAPDTETLRQMTSVVESLR